MHNIQDLHSQKTLKFGKLKVILQSLLRFNMDCVVYVSTVDLLII